MSMFPMDELKRVLSSIHQIAIQNPQRYLLSLDRKTLHSVEESLKEATLHYDDTRLRGYIHIIHNITYSEATSEPLDDSDYINLGDIDSTITEMIHAYESKTKEQQTHCRGLERYLGFNQELRAA